jgi:hypothetical protein
LETPWSRARKLRTAQQEQKLGQMEGGSQQINSGRFWHSRRDAKLFNFLIEARTNENPTVKSYRIERDEWLEMRKDAYREPPGLKPAMQITIQDLDLVVIELDDFRDMNIRLIALEAMLEDAN